MKIPTTKKYRSEHGYKELHKACNGRGCGSPECFFGFHAPAGDVKPAFEWPRDARGVRRPVPKSTPVIPIGPRGSGGPE